MVLWTILYPPPFVLFSPFTLLPSPYPPLICLLFLNRTSSSLPEITPPHAKTLPRMQLGLYVTFYSINLWPHKLQLFASPCTVARQGPLPVEFPRQEFWSGSLLPSPGDIPDPGIKPVSPVSPALAGGSLPLYHLASQWVCVLNGFPAPLLSAISLSKEKLGSSCTSCRLKLKGKELEAYLQGLTSET